VVISNADPLQTYLRLLPPERVSRILRLRLERMRPSLSLYTLYLGIDRLPSAVGIEHDELFVSPSGSADLAWERARAHEIHHTDWAVASYEHSDPGMAPPGCGVLSFTELTPAGDWLDLAPEAYRARKARVQRQLLAKYCRRFPGLEGCVVVQELATPRTLWRYTRNSHGAVYGFEQTPDQAGPQRLGNRAPVAGLYLTGSWTWAGGGYEGALMSGLQTCAAVLAQHPAPRAQPAQRLGLAPHELPPIPTPPADDEHRLPLTVFSDAVDGRGLVDACSVLRFMDRGRVEACEATCEDTAQDSWLTRYVVNVYRLDLRLVGQARLGQRLEVRSELRRSSSHRAVFQQRIVAAGSDRAVAEAAVEVTFQEPAGGLVPVPEGFKDAEITGGAGHHGLPPIPFSQQAHFGFTHSVRVYYEDTDAQGISYHVTYLRFCEQALQELLRDAEPDSWRLKRADMRYLKATSLGDRLQVRVGARRAPSGELAVDLRVVRADDGVVVVDVIGLLEAGESLPPALAALLER